MAKDVFRRFSEEKSSANRFARQLCCVVAKTFAPVEFLNRTPCTFSSDWVIKHLIGQNLKIKTRGYTHLHFSLFPPSTAVKNTKDDTDSISDLKLSWYRNGCFSDACLKTLNTWGLGNPCDGTPIGISCFSGRVVSIKLPQLLIAGGFPSSFSNLDHLTELQITVSPNLVCSVSTFTSLKNLTRLDLFRTGLSGNLTDITKLSQLAYLDVSYCGGLQGPIPVDLTKLQSLVHVNASRTLLSGSIPATLGQSTQLTNLDLSNNPRLLGTLPSELGTLRNLKNLGLSNAGLSGRIPESFGFLHPFSLFLDHNSLTGTIPQMIGELAYTLYVDNNPGLCGPVDRFKLRPGELDGTNLGKPCPSPPSE